MSFFISKLDIARNSLGTLSTQVESEKYKNAQNTWLRYTFKKWNTDDWARHNENKFFQVLKTNLKTNCDDNDDDDWYDLW